MISLNKRQAGFTIVELLIVIIVIALLGAIVVNTHSSIELKTRNTQRVTEIDQIQEQLEAFYSQNGYYPSNTDINSASWREKNMKTLNTSDMIDPSAASGTTPNLALSPAPKVFSYDPTNSGASCEKADTTCNEYTLTATYQGTVNGESTYTKLNLD
jgi:prepilin-type N-terminal cleavage/methylation domain-containing protein